MEVTPHGPHQRRARNIFTIFKIIPFFFVYLLFVFFSFFSNFLKIVKSSISPLIFISITYYYFSKKKDYFLKANTIYSLYLVWLAF